MDKPAQGQRQGQPKARAPQQSRGRGGLPRGGQSHAPRGGQPAHGASAGRGGHAGSHRGEARAIGGEGRAKGGDAPLRRPSEGGQKDRAWRDADFRDAAPAFLRGR
jgi:hypothetical protein